MVKETRLAKAKLAARRYAANPLRAGFDLDGLPRYWHPDANVKHFVLTRWLLVTTILSFGGASAYASDALIKRTDTGRIVVQGVAFGSLQVGNTGTEISIALPKDVNVTVDQSLKNSGVDYKISKTSNTVTLSAKSIAELKVSGVGTRTFIDAKISASPKSNDEAKEKANTIVAKETPPQPAAPAVEKAPKDAPPAASEKMAEPVAPQQEPTPVKPEPLAPAATAIENQAETMGTEAVIKVSGSDPLAIAAFIRNGTAWIITDQTSGALPLTIENGEAWGIKSSTVESARLTSGQAYKLNVPKGTYMKVSGGGLLWTITLTKKAPTYKYAEVKRDLAVGGVVLNLIAGSVVKLPDPSTGEDLAVILSNMPDAVQASAYHFVDFDLLPAAVGAVVKPIADGISVRVDNADVKINRRGGLRLDMSRGQTVFPIKGSGGSDSAIPQQNIENGGAGEAPAIGTASVFAFAAWARGGAEDMPKVYSTLLHRLELLSEQPKNSVTVLLDLAKYMVSIGLPYEAEGYLDMAVANIPEMKDSTDYRIVRGAADVLTGRSQSALAALTFPSLDPVQEIRIWKALALAQSERISEAVAILPTNLSYLSAYPETVRAAIVPLLLDMALIRNDADTFQNIYGFLPDKAPAFANERAFYAMHEYYRARQTLLHGKQDEARHILSVVSSQEGAGAYPVRAQIELSDPAVFTKPDIGQDVISRLERYRYAWRGDALELQLNRRLGALYIQNGDARKGLYILKDAMNLSADAAVRAVVRTEMQQAFLSLFRRSGKERLSPLDAATTAIEFRDLIPPGDEGTAIINRVIDDLVSIDLLDRAVTLLQQQIAASVDAPENAARLIERAAGLRILDKKPDAALVLVDSGVTTAATIQNETVKNDTLLRLSYLKIRALADANKIDEALLLQSKMLQSADTLKLKADISWRAKRWSDAADAFTRLLRLVPPPVDKPLAQDTAQMILNMALAYNLAGDSGGLDQVAVAWGERMSKTPLAQPFKVLTRVGGGVSITDKDSLLKMVQEVDLFKSVLNNYVATKK